MGGKNSTYRPQFYFAPLRKIGSPEPSILREKANQGGGRRELVIRINYLDKDATFKLD